MNTNIAHDISQTNRTADVFNTGGNVCDFDSFLLSENVLAGLKHCGFVQPSPIQVQAIPLAKCGLDLVCQAKSGTGKTCVLAVCTLETIDTNLDVTQALILAPTREIAHQIHGVVTSIGCFIEKLRCGLFIGGLPIKNDIEVLKQCHVAVATPGRVKFLIEKGYFSTKSIRLFILDEADKLLQHGSFEEQINWIFSTLSKDKQMLALSATYPEILATHLNDYMRDPIHVRINPQDVALKGVVQFYKIVKHHALPNKLFDAKYKILVDILRKVPFQQCMVFSNLHSRAERLSRKLIDQGWPSTFIAGTQVQKDRLEAIDKLKKFHCRILITTDLTSRGIDCDKVNLVFNLDLPWDSETYLHRIGRAGRFGSHGVAISLVSENEEKKQLLEMTKALSKRPRHLPGFEQLSTLWDNLTLFEQSAEEIDSLDSTTANLDSMQMIGETLPGKDASDKSNSPAIAFERSSETPGGLEVSPEEKLLLDPPVNELSLASPDISNNYFFREIEPSLGAQNELSLNTAENSFGFQLKELEVSPHIPMKETEVALHPPTSKNEVALDHPTKEIEVGLLSPMKGRKNFENMNQKLGNEKIENELTSETDKEQLEVSSKFKDDGAISSNILVNSNGPRQLHKKEDGYSHSNKKKTFTRPDSTFSPKKPVHAINRKKNDNSSVVKKECNTRNEVLRSPKYYGDNDADLSSQEGFKATGLDPKYYGDNYRGSGPRKDYGDNDLDSKYHGNMNESPGRYGDRFLDSKYDGGERCAFNQDVFMDRYYKAYHEQLNYWRRNNQFNTSYPMYYSYYPAQNMWQNR